MCIWCLWNWFWGVFCNELLVVDDWVVFLLFSEKFEIWLFDFGWRWELKEIVLGRFKGWVWGEGGGRGFLFWWWVLGVVCVLVKGWLRLVGWGIFIGVLLYCNWKLFWG